MSSLFMLTDGLSCLKYKIFTYLDAVGDHITLLYLLVSQVIMDYFVHNNYSSGHFRYLLNEKKVF
jgi:hypothetical protein